MKTAKEMDELFVESFGDKSLGDPYSTVEKDFFPIESFEKLEETKKLFDIKANDEKTWSKIVFDNIVEFRKSCEFVHDRYVKYTGKKVLPKDISTLILMSSNIFNLDDFTNFYTADVLNKEFSSRFTKVFFDGIILSNIKIDNKPINDNVLPELDSLISTIIEYFDPRVVSYVMTNLEKAYPEYFTSEKITNIHETLFNKEKIVYANDPNKPLSKTLSDYLTRESVTAMDIITNKSNILKDVEVSNKSEITSIFTVKLFNSSIKDQIDVMRYIKDDIISWIKTIPIESRTKCPKTFDIIDMNSFVSDLYIYGLTRLGDAKNVIESYEKRIDEYTDKLESEEIDEKVKESIQKALNSLKESKDEYLTFKSMIAFLLQETVSNEDISSMIYTPDSVVNILVKEPPVTFGIHDSNSVISSLFVKRDFQPLSSKPINPYYIHFNRGDVSSKEAYLIAAYLAAVAHPQMRSLAACAGILDYESLETFVNTLKYHLYAAKEITYHGIKNVFMSLNNFISNYESNEKVKDGNSEYVKALKDIYKSYSDCDTTKTYVDNLYDAVEKLPKNDIDPEAVCDDSYNIVTELKTLLAFYKDYLKKYENVESQVLFIINSFKDSFVVTSAIKSRDENKPIFNFWPITTQYEYEIEEPDPNYVDPKNEILNNLKPGDVIRRRYSSRYSMTNPD